LILIINPGPEPGFLFAEYQSANFASLNGRSLIMSDEIKHECGLAFIRLRKPFSFYQQQHGTVMYGLNKLYLLMEKQHNRGQDGAGIAVVKLNTEPGSPFLHRMRSNAQQPIADLFFKIGQEIFSRYNIGSQFSMPDGITILLFLCFIKMACSKLKC